MGYMYAGPISDTLPLWRAFRRRLIVISVFGVDNLLPGSM